VLPSAAFRINPAISSGCNTNYAWLELSERVIALAFIHCSNCEGIHRLIDFTETKNNYSKLRLRLSLFICQITDFS
jgi:hypothetical protein